MATLTPQTLTKAGSQPSLAACASGGDEFANSGNTIILITNANASSRTLTIVSQATMDGLAVADRSVTIPGTDDTFITDLDKNVYNDTNGRVQLTYSTEVDLTIAILDLP
jgi:hypothetical protein